MELAAEGAGAGEMPLSRLRVITTSFFAALAAAERVLPTRDFFLAAEAEAATFDPPPPATREAVDSAAPAKELPALTATTVCSASFLPRALYN